MSERAINFCRVQEVLHIHPHTHIVIYICIQKGSGLSSRRWCVVQGWNSIRLYCLKNRARGAGVVATFSAGDKVRGGKKKNSLTSDDWAERRDRMSSIIRKNNNQNCRMNFLDAERGRKRENDDDDDDDKRSRKEKKYENEKLVPYTLSERSKPHHVLRCHPRKELKKDQEKVASLHFLTLLWKESFVLE